MSAQPTVRIPSDTRGDDWGARKSREMHERAATAIDRQLDGEASKHVAQAERKQVVPRHTRMKIRAYRAS